MKIIFDSHALVWFVSGDRRFPIAHREIVEAPETQAFVSAVCVWEMASKVRRGRWPEADAVLPLIKDLIASGEYLPLPITIQHAEAAGLLPGVHHDPFDRMLAAQARVENATLLTGDTAFREFAVTVLW